MTFPPAWLAAEGRPREVSGVRGGPVCALAQGDCAGADLGDSPGGAEESTADPLCSRETSCTRLRPTQCLTHSEETPLLTPSISHPRDTKGDMSFTLRLHLAQAVIWGRLQVGLRGSDIC